MNKKPKFRFNESWRQDKIEGSSNIKATAFDEVRGHLYIEFHTGWIYRYDPFTLSKYEAFISSPSVGSYFSKNIAKNKKIITKQM